MRVLTILTLGVLAVLAAPRSARAEAVTFEKGSLIIPMDVDYQDAGMLKAFGLLDRLLRAGVPVKWVIKTPKVVVDAAKGRFEADFTATAKDFKTSAAIAGHAYRGGPFVIDVVDAAAAKPVITAWQVTNTTTVHVVETAFTGFVSKRLSAAPAIAVFADGNQNIAFSYLNAAGIPDKNGVAWTATSPDVLTPLQVMGPTSTNHTDGALFRASGQPAFCEIMTMHWKVDEPEAAEVNAELASFLKFPVHVNAECQAVNALEGAPPVGGRSNFVASKGFAWPAPSQPATVEFLNSSLPFAQMDGAFKTVGGSEPAYALAPGSLYYDTGIVMVKGAGKALGLQDVWMTGYANSGTGTCPITDPQCVIEGRALGKVSYLGGHSYDVKMPISLNPSTQGARLFLNSLYEAGCVTDEGQPKISVEKSGPAETSSGMITYSIDVLNLGLGPALDLKLTDALPAGSTFISATKGGVFAAGTVTWTIGDIGKGTIQSVDVTLKLPTFGTFSNTANATFTVGVSKVSATSNTVSTKWIDCAADAGACVCSDGAACSDAGDDTALVDATLLDASSDATSGDGTADSESITDGSSGDAVGESATTDSSSDTSSEDSSLGDSSLGDSSTGADGDLVADSGPGDLMNPDAGTDSAGGCGCGVAQHDERPWLLGAFLGALGIRRRRSVARTATT